MQWLQHEKRSVVATAVGMFILLGICWRLLQPPPVPMTCGGVYQLDTVSTVFGLLRPGCSTLAPAVLVAPQFHYGHFGDFVPIVPVTGSFYFCLPSFPQ